MQHIFFLNFVKIPFREYMNLSSYGVSSHGRNFYLTGSDGVRLGCWHILPESISKRYGHSQISEVEMEQALSSTEHPIIIYLHGNAFDRTDSHRCNLYNVLSSLEFHVFAVDYRGYGDSTGFPTEVGIIEDAKQVYKYVNRLAGNNRIFIWGHSMGTGVACGAVMDLSETSELTPAGLVLEAPFNNLHDVIMHHPLSTPFRWLPWFNEILVEPLLYSGLNMSSDLRISRVKCPILILHAEDDHIIPVALGRLLRDSALAAQRDVTYVEFEGHRNFRHKYISMAEELPVIVRSFVGKCLGDLTS